LCGTWSKKDYCINHNFSLNKFSQLHHASKLFTAQERPGTESWVSMDRQQIPLMLNYAQCKLNEGDCTTCIHICTEVLDKVEGADNVKAYYKRGKAHSLLLNERECCEDFTKAMKLDPKVRPMVEKQLRLMQAQLKSRDKDLHQSLRGMFD